MFDFKSEVCISKIDYKMFEIRNKIVANCYLYIYDNLLVQTN